MHPSTFTRLGLTVLLAVSLLAASFGGTIPQAHASNPSPDIAPDGLSAQNWTDSRTQIQAPIAVCTATSVFTSAANVSVGTSPRPVVTGDFNNDGNLDFATTNYNDNNVSIRLGNGDGTFTNAADVSVGTGPSDIATGDFNNDSNLDFATANYNASNLSIRLGNGDGTFTSAADVAAPNPMKIATSDFNNDGNRDIVATDYSGFGYIRLGNGDGTFTNAADVSGFGLSSGGVAVGDFNNDGNQDFAAVSATVSSAYIRLGNGDGTFTNAADVAVGSDPSSIAVGDFNNDGNPDLAVTAPGSTSYSVSIRLGNGDGTFSGTTELPSGGYQVNGVALGDFNDDGNQDVAFAINSQGVVAIHLGDGIGGFSAISNVSVGSVPLSVAVGDFNNDSNLDFAAANYIGNDVSIRLGDCVVAVTYAANGGTGLPPTQANVPLNGSFIVAANTLTLTGYTFTGWNDGTNTYLPGSTYNAGTSNVTLTAQWAQNNTVTTVSPAANSHTAALTDNVSFTANDLLNPASLNPFSFAIYGREHGYMAGITSIDGSLTVASYDPTAAFFPGETIQAIASNNILYSSNAPIIPYIWQFRTAVSPSNGLFFDSGQLLGNSESSAVKLGDLDNDGDLDAFVANFAQPSQVWINDGSGTFSDSGQSLGSADSMGLALGDLDMDGDLDAFVVNATNQPDTIWLNDSTGIFTDSGQLLGTGDGRSVDLGDLDGDGDLDAFVANATNQPDEVWLNDGSGTFTDSGQSLGTSWSMSVDLGDLDGDGDLDAFTASNGQPSQLWWNDGSGTFFNSGQNFIGMDSWDANLGDVDSDGDLDAFVANGTGQPDQVLLNDGAGNLLDSGQTLGNLDGRSVSLADLDGDGDLDAFVTNLAQGNQVWLNGGGGTFTDSGQILGLASSQSASLGDLDGDGDLDAFVGNISAEPNQVWLNMIPIFPQVLTVTPASNSHTTLLTDNVGFTANLPLFFSSVNPSTFIVHGGENGRMGGLITSSGGDTTFTVDPTANFFPGEIIQASVTSSIIDNADSLPITPYVWQFRTTTQAGTALLQPHPTRPDFGSGASRGLAVGDVNNDGFPDVIMAKDSGAPEEVWLNDGTGDFGAATSSTFGAGDSMSVALGDVDGDGDLDAAVSQWGALNEIWLNDGVGNFGASAFSTFGSGTSSSWKIALGDLDGDGDLDALVACGWGEAEEIWLNDGIGNFSAHPTRPTFGAGDSLDAVLADLDNDGDLDAAIANDSAEPETVWLNDGSGDFGAAPYVTFGAGDSRGLDWGDVDGDGDADLVVANYTTQPDEVWLNDGTGNFGATAAYSFGTASDFDTNLGDIDGDGDLDVVTASLGAEEIWLNQGGAQGGTPGDFGTAVHHTFGTDTSWETVLADVNADGILDAVVANWNQGTGVWLNASAATQIISVTPASNSHTAQPTDNLSFTSAAPLDPISVGIFSYIVHGGGHGHMVGTITPSLGDTVFTYDPTFAFFPGEIVQASASSSILDGGSLPIAPYVWQFRIATSAGTGQFTDSGLSLTSPASWGVSLGDLDGDGDLDAYVTNRSNQPNQIFFGDGLGSFYDSGQSLGSSDTLEVALGDLDGDGDLDAFEANYAGQTNRVWLNNGSGTFTDSGQSLGTATSTDIGLGDLDGDGDLDAFVANGNNEPDKIYLNDGSGTFTDSGQSLGTSNTEGITLGDLDNDGDLDAFTVNLAQPAQVWLNNGDGNVVTSGQVFPSYQSNDVALGDLDGDGDLDAFITNFNQANTVWLNDGFGVFTDSGQSLGTLAHTAVSLGDVDADGDLDAFVTAANNLPETLWLNDGTGVFYSSGLALGTVTSEDTSLGDVNGDGSLDAFVISGSANSLWLNPVSAITANDDFASVLQDSATNSIDVLANDLPTGILFIDQVGPAANGSVVNNFSDVIYTPNPGFYGTDVFTYTTTDEVNFGTATVYVTVLPTIPQADLLIRNLRASPSDVCRGQNFSLALRPTNQGNLDAGAHSILLYNEASPDLRDKLFGQIPIGGLLAGQGKNYALSTSSFITGTRYLVAVTDGNQTIAEFDELNNASFITLTVQDDPAPQGSISLGDGSGSTAYVTSSVVTVTLQASDSGNCATSVGQMRFSINGIISGWEPYTTTKAITLPTNGSAPLTIYAQFKDLHNNVGSFVGATIFFDNQPPRSGITAPNGLTSTSLFTVTWQGFDEGSGVSDFDVQVNPDGRGWTDWLTQATTTKQAYQAKIGQTVCLRVRARDLAGNVEAYPPVASACVEVVPPVASDDLRPQNILLTQGIQTAANSVPLIAGRPLLVQVPVEAGKNFDNVNARLHILQGGRELPGSPIDAANGPLTLGPNPVADANQFQFLLPSAWLSGTLEIYADIDPANTITESDEKNNRFPSQGNYPLIFDGPRILEITLVPVAWQRGNQSLAVPAALLFEYADFLQRMYPVSQMNLHIHAPYPYNAENVNWPELLSEIDALRSAEQPNANGQKFVALLPYPGGGLPSISETVGLAYQPGGSAVVFAYSGGGEALALNLAHTFGLERLTVTCPPASDGTINHSGWDFIRNAILAATTPDLMTGCPGAWVSPGTYQVLLPKMGVSTSAYQRPAIPRGRLLLTGWLDPTAASGGLNTAFQFADNLAALPTSHGDFHIQLINANGHAEIIRDIAPDTFSDPKLPAGQQLFAVMLPSLTDLSAARLYYQDKLLSELLPGPAPLITITSSIPLTLTMPTHTLTWQAENATTYLVRYSWNGGINWMQLSPPLMATTFEVDLTSLPGTENGIFEVLASGGLRSAAAQQSGFTLANRPPQATIISPLPGESVFTNTLVLQGAAFDLEDGILADEQLVWISDKDGVLGVGSTLVVQLSPGGHVITLQVTDSRGRRVSVCVDFRLSRVFLPLVNR